MHGARIKDYPPNWRTEIVPAIRTRANGKCEHCGLTHGQTVWLYKRNGKKYWATSFDNAQCLGNALPEKQIKVICAVAHLDHDESNMQVTYDRLRYLCQKCHLAHDYEDNLERLKEMRTWLNKTVKFRMLVNKMKRL